MIMKELTVKIIPPETTFNKTKYKLSEELVFEDITVPKDFITDGASVPRFLWCIFPPTGRYFYAAVIHDYILESSEDLSEDNIPDWKSANKYFGKALKTYGVNLPVRLILHNSVRFYGMFAKSKSKTKAFFHNLFRKK